MKVEIVRYCMCYVRFETVDSYVIPDFIVRCVSPQCKEVVVGTVKKVQNVT